MARRAQSRPFTPTQVIGTIGVLAAAGTAISAATSPWVSALAIRAAFTRGAAATSAEMAPYAPTYGVDAGLNLPYGERSTARFDLFTPAQGTTPLATIVWIHGGAWISGTKNDLRPYLRMLAAQGYTVVGVGYPMAPEERYPVALTEINKAIAHLLRNAGELRIDPRRIILAGDSAGAQLASQLATATTNPEYARQIRLVPALKPHQLSATILHCGIYDIDSMADVTGLTSWGFKSALWAYIGVKNWTDTPAAAAMSTINHVTGDFPPTFISGGNADLLTETQSEAMAARLATLGVAVTDVFFDADATPQLPHEYQFHLNYSEARQTLVKTLRFLEGVTG